MGDQVKKMDGYQLGRWVTQLKRCLQLERRGTHDGWPKVREMGDPVKNMDGYKLERWGTQSQLKDGYGYKLER
jgi:hypothetical protein